MITPEAAAKSFKLYAEHTTDALSNTGKHPNINRLIAVRDSRQTLRVRHVWVDLATKE